MRLLLLVLALVLSTAMAPAKQAKPGTFDYFVLALSWSPTYCASNPDDRQQCAPGRRFSFIVHGLWPQYETGWPQFCDTREQWVDQDNIDAMLPIMPSKRLIIHQWKKHGSCSGVSQNDYFRATRLLFEKLRIPARYLSPTADVITTPGQLVTDFVKTNRDLTSDMISVQCGNARDRARLTELRICLNKRGSYAPCGKNEDAGCQAKTLVMPRVR